MLLNVPVGRKVPFEDAPQVGAAVAEAERRLADKGRVLLRYSGTEAKVRVMVEGEDHELVSSLAADIADACEAHLR